MEKFVKAEFICDEDFEPGCCSDCPVAEYDWHCEKYRCPLEYDYYDCRLVLVEKVCEEE